MESLSGPVIVSTDVRRMSAEDALAAGLRLGSVYRTVGLAIDADPCSVPVAEAFAAGVVANGSDVVDAGECPVPAAVQHLSRRCGCIAAVGCPAGSGMPCISLYRPDGSSFSEVDLRVLEGDPVDLPEWSAAGRVIRDGSAADEYKESMARSGLRIGGYVVMDCGCGCTSSVAPDALSSLGAYVSTLNSDRRPVKPRSPAAAEADLMPLSAFVDASVGCIGIAYNADGTRFTAMTEDGKTIACDTLLALFLRYLEPRTAVIPFNSPAVVEDAFWQPYGMRESGHGSEEGRRLIRGTSEEDIIDICRREDVDFAALGDGRFIFPETSLCPDAVYASAVFAELSGTRAIRALIQELPQYFTRRVTLKFDGTAHMFDRRITEAVSRYETREFIGMKVAWKVILGEGMYTVTFRNGILVLDAVAYDQLYLATMLDEALSIVRSCI